MDKPLTEEVSETRAMELFNWCGLEGAAHQRDKKKCCESYIAHSRTEFEDSVCLSPAEGRLRRPVAERHVALPPERREGAMPIAPFLDCENFDAETRRILGVAFEAACVALRTGCDDDYINGAIAKKIIDFAKAGERNPDLLCERVLADIRMHM